MNLSRFLLNHAKQKVNKQRGPKKWSNVKAEAIHLHREPASDNTAESRVEMWVGVAGWPIKQLVQPAARGPAAAMRAMLQVCKSTQRYKGKKFLRRFMTGVSGKRCITSATSAWPPSQQPGACKGVRPSQWLLVCTLKCENDGRPWQWVQSAFRNPEKLL